MSRVPATERESAPPAAPPSSERARNRGRRALRGLAASLAALVLALGAAELLLRVSGDREAALAAGVNRTNRRWVELARAGIFEEVADPVRRYAMRPGAEATVDDWTFRVSRHRTRGPEFTGAKPPGEKRLLCLGDSFAFGMWADEDETLVAHLARLANEVERERGSGVVWRPLNLGVPGYTTAQALRALEQDGLRLDPDVVVLYFNTNDIAREGFFLDEELGALRSDHLPLPVGLRRALWSSHLYGWIARVHARRWQGPKAHLDPRAPWAHTRPENLACTRRAIERIAETCAERGIPLFFVHQPLFTWSGEVRRRDWDVLPLVEWAEEVRAALAIPGISLLGWLRGYSDGVDRVAGSPPGEEPPPDSLPDLYVADETVQAAIERARGLAADDGRAWEELDDAARGAYVARAAERGPPLPDEPDFHMTGDGYAHLARLCHEAMRAEGILP